MKIGRIGSGKGIKDGASYNIYIFLKKQVYNGKEWEDATPQDIKYITGSNGKALTFTAARSEERRVGKECRSRWSPYH